MSDQKSEMESPDLELDASAHNALRAAIEMYGRMLVNKHSAMLKAQQAVASQLMLLKKLELDNETLKRDLNVALVDNETLRQRLSTASNGFVRPHDEFDGKAVPGAS